MNVQKKFLAFDAIRTTSAVAFGTPDPRCCLRCRLVWIDVSAVCRCCVVAASASGAAAVAASGGAAAVAAAVAAAARFMANYWLAGVIFKTYLAF